MTSTADDYIKKKIERIEIDNQRLRDEQQRLRKLADDKVRQFKSLQHSMVTNYDRMAKNYQVYFISIGFGVGKMIRKIYLLLTERCFELVISTR